MINLKRVFEELKQSFIELYKFDFKSIIILFFIAIICFMPINYYVIVGGGISDIASRVEVEDGYKSKGSLNISYVTETDGTLLTYILSNIIPSWKLVSMDDYKYTTNEKKEDIAFRSELDLQTASSSAIKVAYDAAGRDIHLEEEKVYIIAVKNDSSKLKVGDEIISLDGNVLSSDEYRSYIATKKKGDIIKFQIKRNNKEKEIDAKIYEDEEGNLLVGIFFTTLKEYKTNPVANIKFNKDESGPSGGLMTTLSIYNQLVKEDITKGLKIAGTGTIDENGTIGEIGGIEYKVLGAAKGKADIFIAPSGDNYKDAKKIIKKERLKIKLIEGKNFDQVIKELKKI